MARFNPLDDGTEPTEKPKRKKAAVIKQSLTTARPIKPAKKTSPPLEGGISSADFMAMFSDKGEPSTSPVAETPNPLGDPSWQQVADEAATMVHEKLFPPVKLPSALEALRAVQREHKAEPQTPAESFGEGIHVYTRAQAHADGVLVDGMMGGLAEVSRQHFRFPVAMTRAVYCLIAQSISHPERECDIKRVWHDILWMAKKGVTKKLSKSSVLFQVVLFTDHSLNYPIVHTLKSHLGPGDQGEPVLTIMKENED